LNALAAGLLLATLAIAPSIDVTGQEPRVSSLTAVAPAELRTADARVDRLVREGGLVLRQERADTLIPGRRHERYSQVVNGVPVYGGDVARQVDDKGLTLSIFGAVYEGISVDTDAKLTPEAARDIAGSAAGIDMRGGRLPRLTVLPREQEGRQTYRLVYLARVATADDITLFFIDANSGEVIDRRSDAHTQAAAVGIGTGVLGDRKKVSTSRSGATYVQTDRLRPPVIDTFDMKGNLGRTIGIINGFTQSAPSDLATDPDNDWNDVAAVDAHTYTGYTYDYFYTRFNRRGLDNANIRIRSFTHPVNRDEVFSQSGQIIGLYYVNAFYAGDGIMVYGEGLPPNVTLGGTRYNYFAGALDIVAHELTHGVLDYSSQLIYQNESGALNEAFADIMGTSVEFFFHGRPGTPAADYQCGEDIASTPFRSMSDPQSLGDPDHYSRRFLGSADNGGVHINSGIANNAFYLAVEGGTNRTSGLSVQGVGPANREQMEKVFYRAFVQLLPANATFRMAREATIQAARDLYAGNTAVERAVTDAWTAVGVQ
jgi:Zn-dependent metalloprotease